MVKVKESKKKKIDKQFMENLTGTTLCTNPKIKPAFKKNTVVILTKDCTDTHYSYNPDLKENEVCGIIECGLCSYAYDKETENFTKLVSTVEWCEVELTTETAKRESDLEEGSVKAEDLKEYKHEF